MKEKDQSVMRVLFKLSAWAGKGYAFPSQRKIVSLSEKWCGVTMSRRTLNRVTSRLEGACFVERVRRHRRGPDGRLVFHSTLYKLQARAFNWAYNLGAWGSRLFRVFRVPKLAQYRSSNSTGYPHPVDNPVEGQGGESKGLARNGPIVLKFRTV